MEAHTKFKWTHYLSSSLDCALLYGTEGMLITLRYLVAGVEHST